MLASIESDRTAKPFLFAAMGFIREHAFPGTHGSFPLLTSYLFDFSTARSDEAFLLFLDLVQQQSSGEEAVDGLLPTGLAFHPQAGGPMKQHDAGGSLVDVLPAVAARADEGFLDVAVAHPERSHALGKLFPFFGRRQR